MVEGFWPRANVRVGKPKLRLFGSWLIPEIGLEFGATLIEGYCVSVGSDEGVGSSEWKALWFESDRADSIPKAV